MVPKADAISYKEELTNDNDKIDAKFSRIYVQNTHVPSKHIITNKEKGTYHDLKQAVRD